MSDYIVIGPERMLRDRSYADKPEPPEWGRDVCYVANAPTAKDAKWAASRRWERVDGIWSLPRENRGDGKHPLAGVRTERPLEGDGSPGGWGRYYVDLDPQLQEVA